MCVCFNCFGLQKKVFSYKCKRFYRLSFSFELCACVPKGQQTQFDNYNFILVQLSSVQFGLVLCSAHFAICLCTVRWVEFSYAVCVRVNSICQCCVCVFAFNAAYTHRPIMFCSLIPFAHSIWKLKSIFLNVAVVGSNPKKTTSALAHALNDHLSPSLPLSHQRTEIQHKKECAV